MTRSSRHRGQNRARSTHSVRSAGHQVFQNEVGPILEDGSEHGGEQGPVQRHDTDGSLAANRGGGSHTRSCRVMRRDGLSRTVLVANSDVTVGLRSKIAEHRGELGTIVHRGHAS
jgi:hypothetical protein